MSLGIDGDGGDAIVGQRGGHRERAVVLIVAESVAEDRYRPAIRGARTGGNKQVEIEILCALYGGNASTCWHRRNEAASSFPILCCELAEGERGYRAWENLQGWRRHRYGIQRAHCVVLLAEKDSDDGDDRKYR